MMTTPSHKTTLTMLDSSMTSEYEKQTWLQTHASCAFTQTTFFIIIFLLS